MKTIASKNAKEYIETLPDELKGYYQKTYDTIKNNVDKSLVEMIQYGMPSFVVPYDIYPDGYQCKPKTELPFISIAANKNSISLHSLVLYSEENIYNWLIAEYTKATGKKPDLGKGCLKLKKLDDIPYNVIAELCKKINVKQWIEIYENKIKRK